MSGADGGTGAGGGGALSFLVQAANNREHTSNNEPDLMSNIEQTNYNIQPNAILGALVFWSTFVFT
ncbi:MAG: hypothetical protein WKF70_05750, partial [Chitinophagaceae bacterium]